MADLVDLPEVLSALGNPSADAAIVQSILDQVEAEFEAACGRTHRPFAAAGSRTEVHDGPGGRILFVDYPVATLTSLTIGLDASAPDETLDVTDPEVVKLDSRFPTRLVRTDGGTFGSTPLSVRVVYTSADDLPEDVALAVKAMAIARYHLRSSGGATTERLGDYSVERAAAASAVPGWHDAIRAHAEVAL